MGKKKRRREKTKETIPKRPRASKIKTRKRNKTQTLKNPKAIPAKPSPPKAIPKPKQAIIRKVPVINAPHKIGKIPMKITNVLLSPPPPAILMKKGYDSEELLDASPFLKKNDMIVPSPPPMYFGDDDDTHSVMTTMTMGFKGKNPDSLIRAIRSDKAKINPFLKVDTNVGMGSCNRMKMKKELMQSEMKTNRS